MKNLVIDIGNTRIKWGLFIHEQMVKKGTCEDLKVIAGEIEEADRIISSSTRRDGSLLLPSQKTIKFSHATRLPVQLDYDTPETLGLDRIAGAVGAFSDFPQKDCLVIDMGTCVTFDLITSAGIFRGGAIAPGLKMRLDAMHHMTGKLPKVTIDPEDRSDFPAKSTVESMKTGVMLGLSHEIQGYISHLKEEFEDLHVILTGGDTRYFESKIKAPIFVRPEIILTGLNRILLYNEAHA